MSASNFTQWLAYQKSLALANDIFELTMLFPKEEKYSLTDQIRRSSRSVTANLSESAARLSYPKHFYSKLADCAGENYETQVWLTFALSCNYLNKNEYELLIKRSEEIGRLLSYMQHNPGKFNVKVRTTK